MTRHHELLLSSVLREWRFLLGHPSVLVLLVGIPLFYGLTVSSLYSRRLPLERPAAVVSQGSSALARELTLALDATPEVAVRYQLASLDEGWRRMRRGEVELLVFLPGDLSARAKRGEPATVSLWINSANMLTYGQAYAALSQVLGQLNQELSAEALLRRGLSRHEADGRAAPLFKAERLPYNPGLSYGDFLVEGVFVIMIQQLVLIGLCYSTAFKREAGSAAGSRLSFAPGALTIAEGGFVAQLVAYVAAVCFVLFVICPLYGWPMGRSLTMLIIFLCFVVSLAPLAVLLAPLFRDRAEVFQLMMFASTPLFLISGFTWPWDQIPRWVRAIASIFPSTPAVQALRVAATKGGDLGAVLPQLGWMATIFLGGLLVTLTVSIAARRRAPARCAGLSADASA